LAVEAERRHLLDVSYRTVGSPVGSLLVAAMSEGLVRIAFDCEDHDSVLTHLAAQISPRILRSPDRLDAVARRLDEYFAGRRRRFEVAIGLRLARGFLRTVLDHLCEIAYGTMDQYLGGAEAKHTLLAIEAA
jgi:methylated-DNA-[protein]-cysteine S-methyltransferase